ncbi:MAG: hypothetical protein HYS13_14815 [Planctomycetia bacterium]|nr:hypothetical protein [Planctomycetia bacterium]
MSFSSPAVQKILNRDFEAAYLNIESDPNSGVSFAHAPKDPPGQCFRGNGEHNIQILFLTPEGEIFSTLSGYVEPEGLEAELEFALATFSALSKQKGRDKQKEIVAKAHADYLEKLGFREKEIHAKEAEGFPGIPGLEGFQNGLGGIPGLPQGGGPPIVLAGGPGNVPEKFFEQFKRARILTDHRFAMRNPLLPVSDFKSEMLVGSGMSFFGSANVTSPQGAPKGVIGAP